MPAPSAKTPTGAPRRGVLPVTVLSGFLGSGKTTLLKHLLQNTVGLRIAALVNDVASVNIDGHLIASMDKAQSVMQLENGCTCCSLRDELTESLLELAQDPNIDYCIVECSGVAEPFPIAEAFSFNTGDAVDLNGKSFGDVPLSNFLRLDSCVTLVDSANFPQDLSTRIKACEKWKLTEEEEEDVGADRDVAEILADQLEFANVIVINKCDLVSEKEKKDVCSSVGVFNSGAKILCTTQSRVKHSDVLNTGLFSMEDTLKSKRWLAAMEDLEGTDEGSSEGASKKDPKVCTKEFGIATAVYRRRKPFHPQRFADVAEKFSKLGSALLRGKGFVWLASRNDMFGEWSQAGAVWTLKVGGNWFCETPKDEWPSTEDEFVKKVMKDFSDDPKIGDRRQEMVLIGQALDETKLFEMMDACLLTDEEMKLGKDKWAEMKDPFPEWDLDEMEDEEDECDHDHVNGKCVPNADSEVSDDEMKDINE